MGGPGALKTCLCVLATAASPLLLDAARADESDPTYLGTITVTGTRTEKSVFESPQSVTVVTGEEIARKTPESVADLLRDVPGVQIVDASVAGMKRLRIRGESSHRVTVLVDGQEITDHSTYGTPFLVDPAVIERIDVIRGPASVLYGSKAIGGVVNIITRKGAGRPFEAELSGTYFSATGGHHGTALLSGTVDGTDYRFFAGKARHGDREVAGTKYDPTGRLRNSDFETDSLSAHLGHRFGPTDNHYVALKAEQDRLASGGWIDPGLLGPQPDGSTMNSFDLDLPRRDRRKVGLFYEGKDLGPVLRAVRLDGYVQTVDRLFINAFNSTSAGGTVTDMRIESDDLISNMGGTAQIDLLLHPDHYVIAGVQYLSDVLEKNTTTTGSVRPPFPPIVIPISSRTRDKSEIRTTSVFVQDEWSPAIDWKVVGGLRYYYIESELKESSHITLPSGQDDRVLASLGVTYSGIPDTMLRGHFSQGYVYPTLLQLFSPTQAGGGAIYANPGLKPETSDNYEVGLRHDSGGLMIDAAAFYTTAQGYIATIACPACPAPYTRQWANVDRATTYGVEILAEYALAGSGLTPYASGAWTRRKFDYAAFSTYNTDVPALSGRLGIRYDWEHDGLARGWLDLFVRAASDVTLTGSDGTTETESGWATLNLSAGADFGDGDRYRLAVNFNNITNVAYRPTVQELPAEGRSVTVTFSMKLY